MYTEIDGTLAITVNDWQMAGLSYRQFKADSQNGDLKILRRGLNGNTLIDAKSIRRPDRRQTIEQAHGRIEGKRSHHTFNMDEGIDTAAREYFATQVGRQTIKNKSERVAELTNQATILRALKRGLESQVKSLARVGKRVQMGEFYKDAVAWYNMQADIYPCKRLFNPRSLERVFKAYSRYGYEALLHGNDGNDSARRVSAATENLIVALWRAHDKPFVREVHNLYKEFVNGDKEFYDKETGEVFRPAEFCYKGRPLEISESTVWNYLKEVLNYTAVYADRNGNFDYANSMRPKHTRHLPNYSLSKVTMDDVCISKKAFGNKWVYRYIAVDVLSGYWFRPAYIVGKPTVNTVERAFRNMFTELHLLGLASPGEIEVEHHLMNNIPWLNEVFDFVRMCNSPTEKRAEHNIRSLKYGVSHRNGNTRGRWYSHKEAFKAVRYKKDGDFIEPEYQAQTIVARDLADIEEHNNLPHPDQKRFPGLTRKQVLVQFANKSLRHLPEHYLYQYIGNADECTLYNNDYVKAANTEFSLVDFEGLKKLKPNNNKVTAYWLPADDGSVERCYIYQEGNYIGEAANRRNMAYNESAIERDDNDSEKMLTQNKRIAKFDKMIRDRRAGIPRVGSISTEQARAYENIDANEISIGVQPAMSSDVDEHDYNNSDLNIDLSITAKMAM